jgi:hypothetical protein
MAEQVFLESVSNLNFAAWTGSVCGCNTKTANSRLTASLEKQLLMGLLHNYRSFILHYTRKPAVSPEITSPKMGDG